MYNDPLEVIGEANLVFSDILFDTPYLNRATLVFENDTQPSVNETITIDTRGGTSYIYKFVNTVVNTNDVLIGVDLATTISNLATKINSANPYVTATANSNTLDVVKTTTGLLLSNDVVFEETLTQGYWRIYAPYLPQSYLSLTADISFVLSAPALLTLSINPESIIELDFYARLNNYVIAKFESAEYLQNKQSIPTYINDLFYGVGSDLITYPTDTMIQRSSINYPTTYEFWAGAVGLLSSTFYYQTSLITNTSTNDYDYISVETTQDGNFSNLIYVTNEFIVPIKSDGYSYSEISNNTFELFYGIKPYSEIVNAESLKIYAFDYEIAFTESLNYRFKNTDMSIDYINQVGLPKQIRYDSLIAKESKLPNTDEVLLTFSVLPYDGDKIYINDYIYTFVNELSPSHSSGEVLIGTVIYESIRNLIDAINYVEENDGSTFHYALNAEPNELFTAQGNGLNPTEITLTKTEIGKTTGIKYNVEGENNYTFYLNDDERHIEILIGPKLNGTVRVENGKWDTELDKIRYSVGTEYEIYPNQFIEYVVDKTIQKQNIDSYQDIAVSKKENLIVRRRQGRRFEDPNNTSPNPDDRAKLFW